MNEQQSQAFFNAINLLAFALGYENLQENRTQSAYNNIHASNQRQAEYLLQEINARFDRQDKKIDEILERLERIKKNDQL